MRNLPTDVTFRHLRFDPDHLETWHSLLSPEEADRVRRFPRAKRREEFVLGRAAARMLLGQRIGTPPGDVVIEVAESGALDVVGSDLFISIAHSGDHAVAAAAPRRLGVDIEGIETRHSDLARFMLHPDERYLLDAIPLDEARSQILCWTIKEATLKAMRTGLRFSPKKLRLDLDFDKERAHVQVDGGDAWNVYFEEWEGYFVALAVQPRGPEG